MEKLAWLGRIVEHYLAFGNNYTVSAQADSSAIFVEDTGLKARRTALKILSYFTLVLPALAFIGKCIYRLANTFKEKEVMERDRFSESDNESVKNDNEEPEVKNQSDIDNLADSSEVDTGAGVKFPSNEAVAPALAPSANRYSRSIDQY